MKTTDSVMREFDKKYPQGITALKFVGGDWIEFDVTKEIKDLFSHSLAEARREWVESVRNKKILSIAKYGNMPAPHDPTYKEAYNQAIDDVLYLLTGDNPERKV